VEKDHTWADHRSMQQLGAGEHAPTAGTDSPSSPPTPIQSDRFPSSDLEKTIIQTQSILDCVSLSTVPPTQTSSEEEKLERENLGHDVRTIINEAFAHSWWFRIPGLILIGAIVFAVAGVIQIQQYKVDIRDVRDKAVEKVKREISDQASDIKKELEKSKNDQVEKIIADADKYVKTLSGHFTSASNGITEAANVDALKSQVSSATTEIIELEDKAITAGKNITAVANIEGLRNQANEVKKELEGHRSSEKSKIETFTNEHIKKVENETTTATHRIVEAANVEGLRKQAASSAQAITEAANTDILQNQIVLARKGIEKAVEGHIETLKNEKEALLNIELSSIRDKINDLVKSLNPIDARVNKLEGHIGPLQKAYAEINPNADNALIKAAGIVLNRGLIVIWTVIALSVLTLLLSFLTWWRLERHLGPKRASLFARWAEGVGLAAVIALAIGLSMNYLATPPQESISGQLLMITFQVALPFALIGLCIAMLELLPTRFALPLCITLVITVGALMLIESNMVAGVIDSQRVQQYTSMPPISLASLLCLLSSSIICSLVPGRRNSSSILRWLRCLIGTGAAIALVVGIMVGMHVVFAIGVVGASIAVIWRGWDFLSNGGLTGRQELSVGPAPVAQT
jgi:hypothetical protein